MQRASRALPPALLILALAACATPGRRARSPGPGDSVARAAKNQLGAPYRFGGKSPREGFDCSGLVWWVYHQNGVDLPRHSSDQFRCGHKVKRKGLAPGDLVFFAIHHRRASHVGIYIGRGLFIHAPDQGSIVRESSLKERYWEKHYLGARRVI